MLVVKITIQKIKAAALFVLGSFVVLVGVTAAQVMSSTNYIVPTDSLNIGGGHSTSDTYMAEDTLGEWSTGENLASAMYRACAGYECFQGQPYMTFSVKAGLTVPGTVGAPVSLGLLTTAAVNGSDGSGINSIFLTTETNAGHGLIVSVKDDNTGLARQSAPAAKIDSADAVLSAGMAGFGICVFSTSQETGSPASLTKLSPYNGTCNKTTGHTVGGVSTTPVNILSSTGATLSGSAEILVKASISSTSPAGNDFQDALTFVATSEY